MKKAIKAIAIGALVLLTPIWVLMLISQVPLGRPSSRTDDKPNNAGIAGNPIDDGLRLLADKLNAGLPRRLNVCTRLESVWAGHKRLTFMATVLDIQDSTQTEGRMNAMIEQVRQLNATRPDNVFKEKHIDLVYIFKDESGTLLGQREISYQ